MLEYSDWKSKTRLPVYFEENCLGEIPLYFNGGCKYYKQEDLNSLLYLQLKITKEQQRNKLHFLFNGFDLQILKKKISLKKLNVIKITCPTIIEMVYPYPLRQQNKKQKRKQQLHIQLKDTLFQIIKPTYETESYLTFSNWDILYTKHNTLYIYPEQSTISHLHSTIYITSPIKEQNVSHSFAKKEDPIFPIQLTMNDWKKAGLMATYTS